MGLKFTAAKKVVSRHFRKCEVASPRELEARVVREKLLARKREMRERGKHLAELQRRLKRVEGMKRGKGRITVKA